MNAHLGIYTAIEIWTWRPRPMPYRGFALRLRFRDVLP